MSMDRQSSDIAARLREREVLAGPFAWHQSWHQLAFLHWPVPAERLRPLIPARLSVDTFDGAAWLGIVPFRMTNVRPRWAPRLRSLADFAELNVRTYVHLGGEFPGVWFFSLDATNPLAVEAARRLWRLPYFLARIGLRQNGDRLLYRARRLDRRSPPAHLDLAYRIGERLPLAEPGSLVHFLTERYCLYASPDGRRLLRVRVVHPPWPLHAARLLHLDSSLLEADGLPPVEGAPLVHYAPAVHVRIWDPEPIAVA